MSADFDQVVGIPKRDERADELRDLADMVERGEISALLIAYRVETDGDGVYLALAALDPRLSAEVFEDLGDMLKEGYA